MKKLSVLIMPNQSLTGAAWVAQCLPFEHGLTPTQKRQVLAKARARDASTSAYRTIVEKRVADWQRAAKKGRDAATYASWTKEKIEGRRARAAERVPDARAGG